MIFEPRKFSFIAQDAVYSMAVGFICGFINRLLSCFLYKGKKRLFVKDMLMGIVFTVLLFSYVVSFANYKVMRWYNVIFALVGMVAFQPGFDRLVVPAVSLVLVTVKFLVIKTMEKTLISIRKYFTKKVVKYQKNTQKSQTAPLQDDDKVLYN